jgi:hypothetical protein
MTMGRKPANGRKKAMGDPIYVRLPEDMDSVVRSMAAREERDMAVVIRRLLAKGLKEEIGIKLAS